MAKETCTLSWDAKQGLAATVLQLLREHWGCFGADLPRRADGGYDLADAIEVTINKLVDHAHEHGLKVVLAGIRVESA